MKKLLAVTLLIALLIQALPVQALASVGKVLTQDEINRARALTGLDFGQNQGSECAYHSGMKPNDGWTATQLWGWLDEKLDLDLGGVCDAFSQAFYTLSDLKTRDPDKYDRFVNDSQYKNAQSMQLEAENLREELRYYSNQLRTSSGVIAEMSRWLSEESNAIFDSDLVRYSARIDEARKNIIMIRGIVMDNAEIWDARIARLRHLVQRGPSMDDQKEGVGSWMMALLTDDDPIMKNAAITRANTSNSRMNRLQMASGLLGDSEAQITVYSDNEVVISLVTEQDGKLVPVDGVDVQARDLLNPNSEWETCPYVNGTVLIPINKLTADEFDLFHIEARIDPTALGYREIVYEDLDLERGEPYTCILEPLESPASNSEVTTPYVYLMTFNEKDIMKSEYDMIYSPANDYEINIHVGVRNPSDVEISDITMYYYENDGPRQPKRCSAKPFSKEGDVYIFRGPWKQRFSPYATEDQRPCFVLSYSDTSKTYTSQLVSIKSATDTPINEGTGAEGGVFASVLDTVSWSFNIPFVDMNVKLNLPLSDYWPKMSINLAGYIVIYVGSTLMDQEMKEGSATIWQSDDAKDYKNRQKNIEKKGKYAEYKSKCAQAWDYYKEKRTKCLGNFGVDVGWFAVASGRWEYDNFDEDVLSTTISAHIGTGLTVTLTASWDIYPIGEVPIFYVSITVGVSAGFGVNLAVDLSWVNGGFKDWTVRAVDNFTVDIGILFAIQVGIGLKGFLDVFTRGSITVDLVFNMSMQSPATIQIVLYASASLGATIFFVTITKTWSSTEQLYPPEIAGDLLQHYMKAGDEKPKTLEPAYNEPQSYPALAAKAEEQAFTVDMYGYGHPTRIIQCNGNLFAFSIYNAAGADGKLHSRVGYRKINQDTGEFGDVKSIQDFIDQDASGNHNTINQRNDYDFDVYASGDAVFILATSAREFDEDGYPVRNDMSSASYDNRDLNMIAYMVVLNCSSDGQLSLQMASLYCQSFQWNKDAPKVEYSYDSLGAPHISFARKFWGSQGQLVIEMYGEIGRVAYPDDPKPVGTTGVAYYLDTYSPTLDGYFLMYPDKSVRSAMGDDYRFIKTCSLMDMDASGRVNPSKDSYTHMYSMSFVGLSRPTANGTGDSAIELFGFDMNSAERRAIVLDQGDIASIVAVKDREAPEGQPAGTTVFYTLGETNGDGAKRYRLCGIHIGPVTGMGTSDLEYDVARYKYDVVMSTCDFDICYLGALPYLYWVSTTPKKQDSDPDVWRVWTMPYDSVSNSLANPSVFSEFTLPSISYRVVDTGLLPTVYQDDHPAMKNVMLTGTGRAYLNAVFTDLESIPEADRPSQAPYSVLSFPEQLKPSANVFSAIPKELVVKAGSFDDMSMGVMNDGNMGLSAMDLSMYAVADDGSESLVETAHIDTLDPSKNAVTMADGTVVKTGIEAAYREEDYDNTPRKRDWVLDREVLAYKIHLSGGSSTVNTDTLVPSDPQHVKTDVLMPGSAGGFTAAFKIPDEWEGGQKTLRMKVTSASSFTNMPRAIALAAGLRVQGGLENAEGDNVELKYVLNERTGRLELQKPANLTGPLAEAIRSGLYATEMECGSAPLTVEVHDLEVSHRVYRGLGGERWVDIVIRNHAATREDMKLVCAVYLDKSKEPSYYVNLPYYENAALSHKTQTITLPISALVGDPSAHSIARVEITSVDRDERALANNEFTLYLGGSQALQYERELTGEILRGRKPVVYTRTIYAREGENVDIHVYPIGGAKPYRYQWWMYDPITGKWTELKNGGSISGVDTDTLTLARVRPEWDGRKAVCVITDSTGKTFPDSEQWLKYAITLRVACSGGGGGEGGGGDSPDTGDHSHLPLYLAVAIAAFMLLWWMRRKRA